MKSSETLAKLCANIAVALSHGEMKVDVALATMKAVERYTEIKYMEIKRAATARQLGDTAARIGPIPFEDE